MPGYVSELPNVGDWFRGISFLIDSFYNIFNFLKFYAGTEDNARVSCWYFLWMHCIILSPCSWLEPRVIEIRIYWYFIRAENDRAAVFCSAQWEG